MIASQVHKDIITLELYQRNPKKYYYNQTCVIWIIFNKELAIKI